ncbi:MAG: YebC/PmpR family DNA-binding transcriptional regulator [Deltaproteobacteria bacterium]|nr:YebC/PmpR family DNA-binding transcriptional regulator [Deltaproteobacteria bacterium]
MSGHSKWSTIKRKKGAADAKRGKLFTKITKEITVAARMGGGDVGANPRLRLAVLAARSAAMPSDNITRAIKRGTGEIEGGQIDELTYEAYGPGGVAFIMEVATDNQNRTISEVRFMLDRAGGNLAKVGSVAFLFARRGMLRFDEAKYPEDKVLEVALEAGAEDVVADEGEVAVYTSPADLHAVKDSMELAGLEPLVAELTMIPSTTVVCDVELARKTLDLVEKLEDHEDIQHVFANFEISDDVMAAIQDT